MMMRGGKYSFGLFIVAFTAAFTFALPIHADVLLVDTTAPATSPGISAPAELQIGPTGIYCVTTPCPWKGVMVVVETGEAPGPVLWSGTHLPPIDAPEDIAERISDVWKNDGCLIVTGQLSSNTLTVLDIVGEC